MSAPLKRQIQNVLLVIKRTAYQQARLIQSIRVRPLSDRGFQTRLLHFSFPVYGEKGGRGGLCVRKMGAIAGQARQPRGFPKELHDYAVQ